MGCMQTSEQSSFRHSNSINQFPPTASPVKQSFPPLSSNVTVQKLMREGDMEKKDQQEQEFENSDIDLPDLPEEQPEERAERQQFELMVSSQKSAIVRFSGQGLRHIAHLKQVNGVIEEEEYYSKIMMMSEKVSFEVIIPKARAGPLLCGFVDYEKYQDY